VRQSELTSLRDRVTGQVLKLVFLLATCRKWQFPWGQ